MGSHLNSRGSSLSGEQGPWFSSLEQTPFSQDVSSLSGCELQRTSTDCAKVATKTAEKYGQNM